MNLPCESTTPFPNPWPVFKVPPHQRFGTDEQWAHFQRARARHFRNAGIFLGLMQWVCTRLGNHRRCSFRACRRKGLCAGRRPQDRWNDGYLYPLVPPCEPTEFERVDQLRDEVKQVLWHWRCQGAEAPPPPPVRYAKVPLVFEDEAPLPLEGRESSRRPSARLCRDAKRSGARKTKKSRAGSPAPPRSR